MRMNPSSTLPSVLRLNARLKAGLEAELWLYDPKVHSSPALKRAAEFRDRSRHRAWAQPTNSAASLKDFCSGAYTHK
jgi:hypothetical protein